VFVVKTNQAQVSEILRSYLDDRKAGPGPGSGCPTPEDTARLVARNLDRRSRSRIMKHVSECASCARVLRSVLHLSGEIDKLTGGVEAIPGYPRDEGSGEREHVGPRLGRRAAVAVLAGLGGVAILTLSVIKLADRPAVRGTSEQQIRLLSPKRGASCAAEEIEFAWEAVPKAQRYSVELFDQSLAKVWRSGMISETRLDLPAEARRSVEAGGTYFWRVIAVLDDAKELASKLSEFSVRK
jgi:hypothetical protein